MASKLQNIAWALTVGLTIGVAAVTTPDLALAKSQQNIPQDLCAAPEQFIRAQIAKIISLQASLHPNAKQPADTVAAWFGSTKNDKEIREIQAQIADHRQQADGFNEMLEAQNCKKVDIDAALGTKKTSTD